jgi:hypothetical protein
VWVLTTGTLLYVAFIVWFFYEQSRPAIAYESVRAVGEQLQPACVGQQYVFEVTTDVRRTPAVIAVTENWISKSDPRNSIIDSTPQWRILSAEGQSHFIITSHVPPELEPGKYTYMRALGLSRPFILQFDVDVLPKEQCDG